MPEYVLGLDIGINSVGWAMIARDGGRFDNGLPVLAGARIFPEGVDDLNTGREKPLGQQRREARGARRTHQRRSGRKLKLLHLLQANGFFPTGPLEAAELMRKNPYPLRKDGLDRRLDPYEFGRALYHLSQRRGFKSNRKQETSKDDGVVKRATAELQNAIEHSGCRTLGEYLASLVPGGRDRAVHRQGAYRARNTYTLRAMYELEFERLWNTQAAHAPDMLTDELKAKVHEAIFFQRPLTWDRERIGDCELEPGEKRAPRAHWLGQQVRMLQEINLLETIDSETGEVRSLTDEERGKLLKHLGPRTKATFDQIRKLLGFYESQRFNIEERADRKYLKGNPVETALQKPSLKKWYNGLSHDGREHVYAALADLEDEDQLRGVALEQWGVTEAQADKLIKIKLPTGRFNLSLKAMRKVLPHLERGLVFSEAKEQGGYSLVPPAAEASKTLPPVEEGISNLTNPLVRRSLTEIRRVVNAIIRQHGKPSEIVVELGRDLKNSRRRRDEIHRENRDRNDENEQARKALIEEVNIPNPSRDDIIRYKLWKECGRICPYTGRSISKTALLTGEVQVDHILPYSRSLDDSYMNKTLCYADENRDRKGNRTPYEAYHDGAETYEAILQRAGALPFPKRRRFTQKEIDLDNFVARQLNDTRYASRLAVGYLRVLGCDVRGVKGQTTAELRRQWGLVDILDPSAADVKTRDDHRHHAIDAAVIALTTRSALQKLSTVKYNPARPRFDPPWDGFRDDVANAVNAINVSHRPRRKLAGKLHEDTNYGPGKTEGTFVTRKPVSELTPAMIEQIRDPEIQRIVREAATEACQARGVELTGRDTLRKVLGDDPLKMPSGVPIKKVRIERVEKTLVPLKTDENGRTIKAVKPGGNHHVEIYENPDGSWTGQAVTRFEAHQRLRRKEPIVCRHPDDGSKFVMSLCINDMVLLNTEKTGRRGLYRVQKTSVVDGSPYIVFRHHTAARIDDDQTMARIQSWGAMKNASPAKVTVDPLGRIHPCND